MEWFSLWLPLVSQVVVPVTLLAWLAFGSHATRARSIVVVALVATNFYTVLSGTHSRTPRGSSVRVATTARVGLMSVLYWRIQNLILT